MWSFNHGSRKNVLRSPSNSTLGESEAGMGRRTCDVVGHRRSDAKGALPRFETEAVGDRGRP